MTVFSDRYERHFARCAPGVNPPTVVLLPGLFAGGWIWEPTWRFLAEKTSFDLLRFADSFLANEEHVTSVEVWRNWLRQSLQALNITRPILVGNSLGALIVVDYAASFPDQTHAAVASGAPGMSNVPLVTFDQVQTKGFLKRADAHRIAKQLFYDPSRIPPEIIDRTYEEVKSPKKIRACLQMLKVAKEYDVSALLPNLRCPLFLVWGDHDRVTPLSSWRPHLDKLEHCVVKEIKDCGHSPMLERPDEFNEVLLEFLQQHVPSN